MTAMTLNVRISGPLRDHVSAKVGPDGSYENVSEYVRDLIRRELEHEGQVAFEDFKAHLRHAFATPDEDYHEWTVEEFLAEMHRQDA